MSADVYYEPSYCLHIFDTFLLERQYDCYSYATKISTLCHKPDGVVRIAVKSDAVSSRVFTLLAGWSRPRIAPPHLFPCLSYKERKQRILTGKLIKSYAHHLTYKWLYYKFILVSLLSLSQSCFRFWREGSCLKMGGGIYVVISIYCLQLPLKARWAVSSFNY